MNMNMAALVAPDCLSNCTMITTLHLRDKTLCGAHRAAQMLPPFVDVPSHESSRLCTLTKGMLDHLRRRDRKCSAVCQDRSAGPTTVYQTEYLSS